MKVSIKNLQNLCISILKQKGLSNKDAFIVFNEYLEQELQGKPDHGFQSFVDFGAKLVEPNGLPKVIKQNDVLLFIDGNKNLGQIVCNKFLPILLKKAKNSGVAMMGITNMHSYLSPGSYARLVAENDLVGIVMNYGGWPRVPPFGSIDPIFGNNPIAIGIPSKKFPIVLDMAASKIALMKIRLAKKLSQTIPLGWAIDKKGNSTTDPTEALAGAVLPFGEYKGSGLALMIELLTKTLFNVDINNKKKVNRGFLFICINPAVFQNINKYKTKVNVVIEKIKKSRKAKGIKEIFVPGEQAYKNRIKNLEKKYIEIDKKIFNEITNFENVLLKNN